MVGGSNLDQVKSKTETLAPVVSQVSVRHFKKLRAGSDSTVSN